MIRKAETKDLVAIKKLGQRLLTNFSSTYNVENYIKSNDYIVLINDENIINAFLIVRINLDFYELEAIYVDEDYREKGIATKMINYLIENFIEKGKEILLEVNSNNENAINLYKKFEFNVINIRKKYYNNGDAYIMKRVV